MNQPENLQPKVTAWVIRDANVKVRPVVWPLLMPYPETANPQVELKDDVYFYRMGRDQIYRCRARRALEVA